MKINQQSSQLDKILNKLVSIPSVTGNLKAASDVIEYVSQLLQPLGMVESRGDINRYPYLIVSTKKPDAGTIWFVCHLDVVPAAPTMFKVTSDNTKYYGRGVFDMKGMAAAALCAFINLPDPKKANAGFIFTTDEETGGKNGVGALVDKKTKGAAVFVFDQSSDWVLQEKMKGVLWLEVTAKGIGAHGARPWLGSSANQTIVDYLHELKKWYDTSIPQDHPDRYYTTFNLGTLHGGEATNQVNDKATATIDVRFTSEEDAQKVLAAAKKIAAKFDHIRIKKIMHEPCVNTDPEEKWFKKITNLMKKVGIKPGPNGERLGHGSTDGRFFAPYNIPVITVRPPGGLQHGPNEWVSKEGLNQLEKLCSGLISATC